MRAEPHFRYAVNVGYIVLKAVAMSAVDCSAVADVIRGDRLWITGPAAPCAP